MSFCFKGGFSNQELVAKDTQTPQVHLFIVSLSLNHLRRQVVQCSTKRRSPEQGEKLIKSLLALSEVNLKNTVLT